MHPKATKELEDNKTYAVRKLGRRFRHFAEINLDENPETAMFFDGSLSARPIVEKLAAYTRTPIIPGKTLLFLDESQACPRSLAALQIASHSSMRHRPELYYWHREAPNATAEVDFVLQRGEGILPVEVKAGLRGAMKSLRLFMSEKRIGTGVRVSLENFATLPDVRIVPLYAIHRLVDGSMKM